MVEIETSVQGPGKYLAKRRSDRGWTQEEVAKKLHLSPSIIVKLEQNQFDEHIPDAFARGYLRNYAKLLGTDQEEIIAAYTQLIGQSKVKNYYEPSSTVKNPSDSGTSINQIVVIVLVAIPIIALFIWYLGRDVESSEIESTVTPETILDTEGNPPQPTGVIEQRNSPEIISTESSSNTASNQVNMNTQQASNIVQQTEVPTGFVDSAEAVLDFDFIDDCWVQVTDSNGEVLAVGLKTAGRRFEVSGVAPISVVLGKPNAVRISYNESEVNLACFPTATTARFTLNSPIACDN